MKDWKIVGRIETIIGATKHWTGVVPRTLRALAVDVEALHAEDYFTYKPRIDRLLEYVRHEVCRRYGETALPDDDVHPSRPVRDEAADALRALADVIDMK
jgi:hypothetical protein